MTIKSDELSHHGVRGQRWGVRRYQNKDGTHTMRGRIRQNKIDKQRIKNLEKARQAKAVNKSSQTDPVKKKKISEMSDAELQAKISRLELEKTYKKTLSEVSPKKTSRGKKIASDILENSAKNIGTQAVTYVMGKGANKVLGQFFDDLNAVNPKKGQKDK